MTRVKINKIENKNSKKKIDETKNCFFEKINKIDKLLAKFYQKRQKTQITSIRKETGT